MADEKRLASKANKINRKTGASCEASKRERVEEAIRRWEAREKGDMFLDAFLHPSSKERLVVAMLEATNTREKIADDEFSN